MSSTNNKKTLEAYENGINEYLAAMIPTVQGSVKIWTDAGLSLLPNQAYILELGSAHGRDADYIESCGFIVDRTDAAQSFVDYMRSKGHEARLLNALPDDYGDPYEMIYANAVLLHFTQDECIEVFKRSRKSLTPNGLFAFSVKVGEGSGWSNKKLNDPRFFSYWHEKPLKELLKGKNFKIVYWNEAASGHDNGNWYHVVAQALIQ